MKRWQRVDGHLVDTMAPAVVVTRPEYREAAVACCPTCGQAVSAQAPDPLSRAALAPAEARPAERGAGSTDAGQGQAP